MTLRDPKQQQQAATSNDDDDEPDDWDKRIFSTGCAALRVTRVGRYLTDNRIAENTKLNDCFFEKKDWRACKAEMEEFRECWKRKGNEERTAQKDA